MPSMDLLLGTFEVFQKIRYNKIIINLPTTPMLGAIPANGQATTTTSRYKSTAEIRKALSVRVTILAVCHGVIYFIFALIPPGGHGP